MKILNHFFCKRSYRRFRAVSKKPAELDDIYVAVSAQNGRDICCGCNDC